MSECYLLDILKIKHLLPISSTKSLSRYIQAATSPKDVVIVVDVSGSMKGLRMTIAKHTINTILDTLGENDFVNIIAVSTHTQLHRTQTLVSSLRLTRSRVCLSLNKHDFEINTKTQRYRYSIETGVNISVDIHTC